MVYIETFQCLWIPHLFCSIMCLGFAMFKIFISNPEPLVWFMDEGEGWLKLAKQYDAVWVKAGCDGGRWCCKMGEHGFIHRKSFLFNILHHLMPQLIDDLFVISDQSPVWGVPFSGLRFGAVLTLRAFLLYFDIPCTTSLPPTSDITSNVKCAWTYCKSASYSIPQKHQKIPYFGRLMSIYDKLEVLKISFACGLDQILRQ